MKVFAFELKDFLEEVRYTTYLTISKKKQQLFIVQGFSKIAFLYPIECLDNFYWPGNPSLPKSFFLFKRLLKNRKTSNNFYGS